mmetsp:Transcript_3082/g.5605  ORF Transcript_3082/g.5605 Transcript_3082/m.5605 type:complete len:364 (+) Transcript_3082:77-1168(+)
MGYCASSALTKQRRVCVTRASSVSVSKEGVCVALRANPIARIGEEGRKVAGGGLIRIAAEVEAQVGGGLGHQNGVEQHIGNVGAGHARLLHVIVVPRQQQPLLTGLVQQAARLDDGVRDAGAHEVDLAVELVKQRVAVAEFVEERVRLGGAHAAHQQNVFHARGMRGPDLVIAALPVNILGVAALGEVKGAVGVPAGEGACEDDEPTGAFKGGSEGRGVSHVADKHAVLRTAVAARQQLLCLGGVADEGTNLNSRVLKRFVDQTTGPASSASHKDWSRFLSRHPGRLLIVTGLAKEGAWANGRCRGEVGRHQQSDSGNRRPPGGLDGHCAYRGYSAGVIWKGVLEDYPAGDFNARNFLDRRGL